MLPPTYPRKFFGKSEKPQPPILFETNWAAAGSGRKSRKIDFSDFSDFSDFVIGITAGTRFDFSMFSTVESRKPQTAG
jgi:hypothetical protein